MPAAQEKSAVHALPLRAAMTFVLIVGIVSLFADTTYEGARSISGPYLAILGASATIVGLVAGSGELVGYGLRLFSGYFADRTRRYWALTFCGYALNLFAVPFLALAGRWELAAVLLIAERAGKGIRTPARDVMLSHATSRLGHGWGFGLHEALDQVGAVSGPLIVAAVLYSDRGYSLAFAILAIPATLALVTLSAGFRLYPRPQELEAPKSKEVPPDRGAFPQVFWFYVAGVACVGVGYADFALMAFHFEVRHLVADPQIPLLFALAMGVDGLAALLLGRLFDRFGVRVLIPISLVSTLIAPLAFSSTYALLIAGVVIWGVGLGAQESIMRSAVATMIPAARRGAAYGVFNTTYGIFWFLGSAALGALYDVSIPLLVLFSVAFELASVPLLVMAWRQGRGARGPSATVP